MASWAALGLMSTLLLVSVASGGAKPVPRSAIVIKPPYTTSVWSPQNSVSSQGCVHAIQKLSAWSKTTGIGGFRELTRGLPCHASLGGVGGSSSASATGGVEIAVPVPIHTSGAHSVVVHWNVSGTPSQNLTPGICLAGSGSYWSCFQQAGWYVDEYTVLLDLTNTSLSYFASNYWSWYDLVYNSTSCYPTCYSSSGTAAYGHGGAVTLFINATLNRTHHYAVESFIGGYADLYFSASYTRISGGSGFADLDLAPTAGQLDLVSIAVT